MTQLALAFAPPPVPPPTGRHRRDRALARLEATSRQWVIAMRAEARRIAQTTGTVTADDLREHVTELKRRGLVPRSGNCMGAIFRGAEWEWTGELIHSTKPEGHANALRVWRLRHGR